MKRRPLGESEFPDLLETKAVFNPGDYSHIVYLSPDLKVGTQWMKLICPAQLSKRDPFHDKGYCRC